MSFEKLDPRGGFQEVLVDQILLVEDGVVFLP
ncbi:hypothetical protein Vi05172_g10677 [Venturia inaequalis]|nr:hypothetical protein Vi05172_g10677 [Venturia inaequalis]